MQKRHESSKDTRCKKSPQDPVRQLATVISPRRLARLCIYKNGTVTSKLLRAGRQAAIKEEQLSVLPYHCLRGGHCGQHRALSAPIELFAPVSQSVLNCLNIAGRVILFGKVHGAGRREEDAVVAVTTKHEFRAKPRIAMAGVALAVLL